MKWLRALRLARARHPDPLTTGDGPLKKTLLKASMTENAKQPTKTEKTAKPSAVEGFKLQSHYLLDPIPEELADGNNFFGKASIQLLKHHGTYQQDNRDQRGKNGKVYSFMVRTAIPGGKLTSAQLLAELDLCDEVGNGTLRSTTRQGLQLHGVVKANLKQVIRRINEVQLTTLSACGDVERNVMCSPCPYKGDPVYDQMQDLADRLAVHLRPHTSAYHELWLTDQETGEVVAAQEGAELLPIRRVVDRRHGQDPRLMRTLRGSPSGPACSIAFMSGMTFRANAIPA